MARDKWSASQAQAEPTTTDMAQRGDPPPDVSQPPSPAEAPAQQAAIPVYSRGSVKRAQSVGFRGQIIRFHPDRPILADIELRRYLEDQNIAVNWEG